MADETIRVDVELTGGRDAARDLGEVAEQARDLERLSPTVEVEADTSDALADLEAVDDKADDVASTKTLTLEASIADARARLDAVGEKLVDIRADADQADRALDNMGGGASGSKLAGLADDAGKVEGGMGRARDNFAGFAGGALTELPQLQGAFAPLTESLGQMGEQLVAGEGSMKDLAVAGGAMAAVSLVMGQIADQAKKIAEFKAFKADEVKAYTEALRDGNSVLDVYAKKLEDAGELVVTLGDLQGDQFDMLKADVAPAIDAVGSSVGEFAAKVEAGGPAIDAWGEALKTAGAKVEDVNLLVIAAKAQNEQLEVSHGIAERTARILGDTYESTGDKAKRLADEEAGAKRKADDLAAAHHDAERRASELEATWDRLNKTMSDQEGLLDLQDAFDDTQTAAEDAYRAASEGADDAEQKARDNERAVLDLKSRVSDYGQEVLGLPPSRVTTMLAQIDSGSASQVRRDLEALAATRRVTLEVIAKLIAAGGGQIPGLGGILTGGAGRAGFAGEGESMMMTVNVTQNLPRGFGTSALTEAHRAVRRSGGLFRTTRR